MLKANLLWQKLFPASVNLPASQPFKHDQSVFKHNPDYSVVLQSKGTKLMAFWLFLPCIITSRCSGSWFIAKYKTLGASLRHDSKIMLNFCRTTCWNKMKTISSVTFSSCRLRSTVDRQQGRIHAKENLKGNYLYKSRCQELCMPNDNATGPQTDSHWN